MPQVEHTTDSQPQRAAAIKQTLEGCITMSFKLPLLDSSGCAALHCAAILQNVALPAVCLLLITYVDCSMPLDCANITVNNRQHDHRPIAHLLPSNACAGLAALHMQDGSLILVVSLQAQTKPHNTAQPQHHAVQIPHLHACSI
jgi:hypothetical protein